MGERSLSGSVLTVVRPSVDGAASALPGPHRAVFIPPAGAQAPAPAQPAGGDSPYGVPASAVQHCCGRGCRHCRIYWNRLKP